VIHYIGIATKDKIGLLNNHLTTTQLVYVLEQIEFGSSEVHYTLKGIVWSDNHFIRKPCVDIVEKFMHMLKKLWNC